MAEKVTKVPAQHGFTDGTINTLTGKLGLTIIDTGLEVAGLPMAQVALDVRMQVTTSLFILV